MPFKVFLLTLALFAAAITLEARAAVRGNPIIAHRYQTGKAVKGIQWLLSGHQHRRNGRKVGFFSHAYTGPINGRYDLRLAHAVRDTKYRMGYPSYAVNGSKVGQYFIDLLTGKRSRSRAYFSRATKRLAALHRIEGERARTACAREILAVARPEVGVHEVPLGSNSGSRVRQYQSATGAYGAPWCVSFAQWVFKQAKVRSPLAWHGPIADDSAGAFYVAGWARLHGWLRSIPKPAYFVVFTDRLGHMGIVESVTSSGFTSIEGNASDSVLRRFHPFGERPEVFIAVPGCDTG